MSEQLLMVRLSGGGAGGRWEEGGAMKAKKQKSMSCTCEVEKHLLAGGAGTQNRLLSACFASLLCH